MSRLNSIYRKRFNLFFVVLLCMTCSKGTYAYKGPQHRNIGSNIAGYLDEYLRARALQGEDYNRRSAITVLRRWEDDEDNIPMAGVDPYTRNMVDFAGSWGRHVWATYFEHFWDPLNSPEGLTIMGNTFSSAAVRVGAIHNQLLVCVRSQDGQNTGRVQECLGRMAHIVEDMGVPAHVLLDPHPCFDYYEFVGAPSNMGDYAVNEEELKGTPVAPQIDVMRGLLTQSQSYPTDQYTSRTLRLPTDVFAMDDSCSTCTLEELFGSLYNLHCVDGFVNEEMKDAMMTDCYKGAQKAVFSYYKYIYSLICPEIIVPADSLPALQRGGENTTVSVSLQTYVGVSTFKISRVDIKYAVSNDAPSVDERHATWKKVALPDFHGASQTREFQLINGGVTFEIPRENGTIWYRIKVWDALGLDSNAVVVGPYMVDSRPPEFCTLQVLH